MEMYKTTSKQHASALMTAGLRLHNIEPYDAQRYCFVFDDIARDIVANYEAGKLRNNLKRHDYNITKLQRHIAGYEYAVKHGLPYKPMDIEE